MTVELMRSPFPLTYRELYLPRGIKDWAGPLPSSRYDGHELTFTGARHGTTADGVHFTGAANSNIVIANNAIQNGQEAIHITIRFKLDQPFAAGAASNFYLFRKFNAVSDWIRVYLRAVDGLLVWEQGDGLGGAGIQFTLTSTTASWAAGVWHIITVSLTNTPTQRLIVDGTVEDTDTAAAVATPPGGDMVIGNSAAAGVDGVIGVISWVVIGVGTTAATALTVGEETDLSKGFPPPMAKVQYMFLLDEGRGAVAYDRGSAGGNGTIGAVSTWAWGRVKQPVISLDGLTDFAVSPAGVDISGDLTWAWVAKMKSTYDGLSKHAYLFKFRINANNDVYLNYHFAGNHLNWTTIAGGVAGQCFYYTKPAIDDYWIIIGTLAVSGVQAFYVNGVLVNLDISAGILPGLPATATVGSIQGGGGGWDVSKPLFLGLMDTAFTNKQALAYSRFLSKIFNLGLAI